MMLVQKPQAFPLSQPAPNTFHHRRHPSAPPAVVVQPTRTPGLLSIAKPQKVSPQRALPSNQRRNSVKPKPTPLVARAPALLNPAEITGKRPAMAVLQAPASPSPVRGRFVPKDKANRNASRSKHGRQPSPPVEVQMHPPSQAEAQIIPSINHFDPFLDNKTKAPAAISVPPAPRQHNHHQLARSAPTSSHIRQSPKTSRFPVCDDMTDAGDMSEAETPLPQTPPATPARAAYHAKTSQAGFPFPSPSPPSSLKKARKHRRSPSEGVFNMSSDEDVPSGGDQALLAFARSRAQNNKAPTTPSHSLSRVTAMSAFKDFAKEGQTAGYFASSLFQNSPSPDELPDPILF